MTTRPGSRAARVVVCVVAAASLTTGGSAAVARSAAPSVTAGTAVPSSVSMDSARDAWAVGGVLEDTSVRGLVWHWNGSAWRELPFRTPPEWSFVGVSALSPTDVWAVGVFAPGAGPTLIEHWDGTAWKAVGHPQPADGVLNAVSGATAEAAWVVGQVGGVGDSRPLVEQWNGARWVRVAVPVPAGSQEAGLSSVSAVGPDDVWAVGSTYDGLTTRGLVEHWDGSSWQVVPSPNPGQSEGQHYLMSVSATGSSDAWAVGESFDASGASPRGYTLHWNGRRWQAVASVNPERGLYLSAVSASSASDVWAVGSERTRGSATFIEHWNGSEWTRVPCPNPGGYASLFAVSSAHRSAWAIGSYLRGGFSAGLFERWDGRRWTVDR